MYFYMHNQNEQGVKEINFKGLATVSQEVQTKDHNSILLVLTQCNNHLSHLISSGFLQKKCTEKHPIYLPKRL